MSATLTNLQQRDLILLQKLIKREDERFREDVLEVYDNYSRFVSRHIINGINRRLPNKLIIETLEIPETYDKMLEIRITRYQRRIVQLIQNFSKAINNLQSLFSYSIQPQANPYLFRLLALLLVIFKKVAPKLKDLILKNKYIKSIIEWLKSSFKKIVTKILQKVSKKLVKEVLKYIEKEIKDEVKNKIEDFLKDIQHWIFNRLLLWGYKKDPDIIAVEFVTVTDKKTCNICDSNNGKIIHINEIETIKKYLPPLHPNCRCYLRPVFKSEVQNAREKRVGQLTNKELLAISAVELYNSKKLLEIYNTNENFRNKFSNNKLIDNLVKNSNKLDNIIKNSINIDNDKENIKFYYGKVKGPVRELQVDYKIYTNEKEVEGFSLNKNYIYKNELGTQEIDNIFYDNNGNKIFGEVKGRELKEKDKKQANRILKSAKYNKASNLIYFVDERDSEFENEINNKDLVKNGDIKVDFVKNSDYLKDFEYY